MCIRDRRSSYIFLLVLALFLLSLWRLLGLESTYSLSRYPLRVIRLTDIEEIRGSSLWLILQLFLETWSPLPYTSEYVLQNINFDSFLVLFLKHLLIVSRVLWNTLWHNTNTLFHLVFGIIQGNILTYNFVNTSFVHLIRTRYTCLLYTSRCV